MWVEELELVVPVRMTFFAGIEHEETWILLVMDFGSAESEVPSV